MPKTASIGGVSYTFTESGGGEWAHSHPQSAVAHESERADAFVWALNRGLMSEYEIAPLNRRISQQSGVQEMGLAHLAVANRLALDVQFDGAIYRDSFVLQMGDPWESGELDRLARYRDDPRQPLKAVLESAGHGLAAADEACEEDEDAGRLNAIQDAVAHRSAYGLYLVGAAWAESGFPPDEETILLVAKLFDGLSEPVPGWVRGTASRAGDALLGVCASYVDQQAGRKIMEGVLSTALQADDRITPWLLVDGLFGPVSEIEAVEQQRRFAAEFLYNSKTVASYLSAAGEAIWCCDQMVGYHSEMAVSHSIIHARSDALRRMELWAESTCHPRLGLGLHPEWPVETWLADLHAGRPVPVRKIDPHLDHR